MLFSGELVGPSSGSFLYPGNVFPSDQLFPSLSLVSSGDLYPAGNLYPSEEG